jgi:hypothetical protein
LNKKEQKMGRKLNKIFFILAVLVFSCTGISKADTLSMGSIFTYPIYSIVNGKATTEGGGSTEISYLNGVQLNYIYCVDILKAVYVPATYNQSVVTTNGAIYGSSLYNAAEVAWLLTNYGTSGQGDAAYALQAAIWTVIFDGTNGTKYALDTAKSSSTQVSLYNSYLTGLNAALLNQANMDSLIGNFLWITPEKDGNIYQGQVGAVPEPTTMLLLGFGLVGLAGVKRRLRK